MSSRSYLGRLARRAGPNPPGLRPPAYVGGALPVAAYEQQTLPAGFVRAPAPGPSAARRPKPAATPATAPSPLAPTVPAAPDDTGAGLPRRDPTAALGPPALADPAPSARTGPTPAPSRAPAAPPVRVEAGSPQAGRPLADFVFTPPAPPRPATAARARADAEATTPPAAEPAVTAPSATGGWAPIYPDPVAVALAAAASWTSSVPALQPPARHAADGDDGPTVVGPRPAIPPPMAERPAEVHIGSIAVEVVPAPESRQPDTLVKTPAPPHGAVAVLARKFTHSYGLHQR